MKETIIYFRELIRPNRSHELQFWIRQKGYEVINQVKSCVLVGDWTELARTRSRKELEKLQNLTPWQNLKDCIACILGRKEDRK